MRFFKKSIFIYLRNFGLLHGTRLFFKLRRATTRGIMSFSIPGIKGKTTIRRADSDFAVFEEVFVYHTYANDRLEDIEYIVDAGANVGLSALYFIRKYPQAKIISIEPDEQNFALLEKNVSAYGTITPVKKGLWNKHAFLKISNPGGASWALEVEETAKEEGSIEALSVDDILESGEFPRIDFLKLDVEGSEHAIFRTNTEWLDKVRFMVIEIHKYPGTDAGKTILEKSARAGFKHTFHNDIYFFYR